MLPPGLAFVAMSERAWKAYEKSNMPNFYFDVGKADFAQAGQTPWTPGLSVYFGLDVALEMLVKEGLENVFARHSGSAPGREGGKAWAPALRRRALASNTVTAVKVPEGVDGQGPDQDAAERVRHGAGRRPAAPGRHLPHRPPGLGA